jgi:hypothetical protein
MRGLWRECARWYDLAMLRLLGAMLLLAAAPVAAPTPTPAPAVGWKARIAGDGPQATYYLAAGVDAATVVDHMHVLQFYRSKGEPAAPAGFTLSDITAALAYVQADLEAYKKLKKIVEVPYNLPVTTLEKSKAVKFQLFPETDIAYGKSYEGTVTKVRVEAGPQKGKELYARWLVDRTSLAVADRVWLRAPGMKAIPLSEDAEAVAKFWRALSKNLKATAAELHTQGRFVEAPQDTQCTITAISANNLFVRVRFDEPPGTVDYWILATIASLDAPKSN